jgi:hypothetical protein
VFRRRDLVPDQSTFKIFRGVLEIRGRGHFDTSPVYFDSFFSLAANESAIHFILAKNNRPYMAMVAFSIAAAPLILYRAKRASWH